MPALVSEYVSASPSASFAATWPTAVPAALPSTIVSVFTAPSTKLGAECVAGGALVVPPAEADHGPAPSPFARTCTRYSVDASSPVSVTGGPAPTSLRSTHCVSSVGSDAPA